MLQARKGLFELETTFSGIKVEDRLSVIDLCAAEGAGIFDIYLTDLDGSFRPPTMSAGGPFSFVSNNEDMLKFVDRKQCITNEARCYSYCAQTCFRSVSFETDPALTTQYTLKVCKSGDPANCIQIAGLQDVAVAVNSYYYSFENRAFVAHLPAGEYEAVFLDGLGTEAWPTFVTVNYKEALCQSSFSDGAVSLYWSVRTVCGLFCLVPVGSSVGRKNHPTDKPWPHSL